MSQGNLNSSMPPATIFEEVITERMEPETKPVTLSVDKLKQRKNNLIRLRQT